MKLKEERVDSEARDDNMNIFELYSLYKECGAASADVASLRGGEMFFALDDAGDAAVALDNGARYAVIHEEAQIADRPQYIKVADVLETMHGLARWHRSMSFVCGRPIPVLVMMGKRYRSEVKELILRSFTEKCHAVATDGRYGDEIDIPLALLGIGAGTEVAIVEISTDESLEVKKYLNVALPNYGLVTDVDGRSVDAASELYDYLRRTSDKVFVDVDDPVLCRMASERGLDSNPERTESLVIPYGVSYDPVHVFDDSQHAAAAAVVKNI